MAVWKQGLTGCWESDRTPSQRYPTILRDGKVVGEHVLACTRAFGPAPEGTQVCHSCDNTRCVNPRHLRWDTPQANVAERQARGRHKPYRKLTPAQVVEVRALLAEGLTQTTIAQRYGVTQPCIGYIARGVTYKEI